MYHATMMLAMMEALNKSRLKISKPIQSLNRLNASLPECVQSLDVLSANSFESFRPHFRCASDWHSNVKPRQYVDLCLSRWERKLFKSCVAQ